MILKSIQIMSRQLLIKYGKKSQAIATFFEKVYKLNNDNNASDDAILSNTIKPIISTKHQIPTQLLVD